MDRSKTKKYQTKVAKIFYCDENKSEKASGKNVEKATENQDPVDPESWSKSSKDLDEINLELKDINRSIDQIEARLCRDPRQIGCFEIEKCVEDDDDQWMLVYGSRDERIRQIQWNSRHIRRQLSGLEECATIATARISALEQLFLDQTSHLSELRRLYEVVRSFHLTKELEAMKCLQRYRYARGQFASWWDISRLGHFLIDSFKLLVDRTESRRSYLERKRHVIEQISATNEFCMAQCREALLSVRQLDLDLDVMGIGRVSEAWGRPENVNSASVGQSADSRLIGRAMLVRSNRWSGLYGSPKAIKFSQGEIMELPVKVPTVANTWYGRMQELLHGDAHKKKAKKQFENSPSPCNALPKT